MTGGGAERQGHGREDEIRTRELEALRPVFGGATRVLELGAGSGLQASILASWGITVAAVDIPGRVRIAQHFNVIEYDGVNLPFPDATFDVVYSSSVLEHVVDLPALLSEVQRVTAPHGRSVHTVPTPAWRAWTIVTHPLDPWKFLYRRLRSSNGNLSQAVVGSGERDPMRKRIPRLVKAPVHGEFPTLRAELVAYRDAAWRARFTDAGFVVEEVIPTSFFHTGVGALPFLSMSARRRLAPVLGHPVKTWVSRPQGAGSPS